MLTCLASFFFLGFVLVLSCLVNNGLSWVWCFGARGFGVRVWCGWWLLGLCAGGCGFCLCGWCGGGLARVFCREWFVGLGVRAGWLGACLVFLGAVWWLARVFAVRAWVCVCFVSLVVCPCLACVGVIGLLSLCVWVLACGRWSCLVEGCDSVGVSWWVWLFGCWVCCPGWRVACVASWRGCFGWCECGV